jgi:hypothetical protein
LGTSVSSLTLLVPPLPSHTTRWQSPGVCLASGELPAACCVVQQPVSQCGRTHSFPVAGQSVSTVHACAPLAHVVVPVPPEPVVAVLLPPVALVVVEEVDALVVPPPPVTELLAVVPPLPVVVVPDDVEPPVPLKSMSPRTSVQALVSTASAANSGARDKERFIGTSTRRGAPRTTRRPYTPRRSLVHARGPS